MAANVGRVEDEMRNHAKVVNEQNFVTALTSPPVPRSQAAKEFFDLMEEEALIMKQKDLERLRSTLPPNRDKDSPMSVEGTEKEEEHVPRYALG